ncbi:non-ribosomal peptide synthetase, partial [Aetokthonos hydrillicola]
MTPIAEFLTNLRSLGIEISLGDGKLNYRAPQDSLTGELYIELRERKQEIIAFLEKAREVKNSYLTSIKPVARNKFLPLSSAQHRLWFLEQFIPNSLAYNVSGAFRLKGSLNVDALEQSLKEIVKRHEILRTNFKIVDGEPTQAIAPTSYLEMPVLDLQHLPESQREAEILRYIQEECQRPFSLEFGPLLRSALLHCQPEEYVLLLNMHHIITDGWSLQLFVQEMSILYEAFVNKRAAVLPALPIQYADFAVWQHNWLQQEGLKAQLAYWKKQLAGIVNLSLPTDRPRPPLQSFHGGMVSIAISQKLVQDLQSLARAENTSLSTVMLAGFQTLLYRYTQIEDIVVASPIANRNRSELEGLIGFFVNTLVLRAYLSGNPSFRELIRQAHQTTLEAYDHQDVPFERLVEELNPERDLSRNPLVQVSYAFQTIPHKPFHLPDLTISPIEYDRENTRYDLELHIWDSTEKGSNIFLYSKNTYDVSKVLVEEAALEGYSWSQETGGLNIIVNYNKDLFEAPTVGRMLLHYLNLLKAIATNPEQKIANLPLLTKAEQKQLLTVWTKPHPQGYPEVIHRIFEARAESTPKAVAAVFGNEEFTYQQLNEKANQLAHYLKKQGVVSEEFVGICLDRSIDFIVAILAILKAGGVYVPLDPSYPQERLGLMIEDTQIPILLTKQALVEKLPNCSLQRICLDQLWEDIEHESKHNPVIVIDPENLAYVNYTSGSTGKPKGIGVCHRSVTNLVLGKNEIQLEAQDRVAHLSNVSFDAVTFEIWGALLNGACVVGVPTDVVLSPVDLATTIAEYKISVMWLTVSVFNQMVKEAPFALKSLRCLIFGGEIANPQRVRQLLVEGSPQHLLNGYGPTETTTFATFYKVGEVSQDALSIPIGRPLSGVVCYILDSNLQPVPLGVAGELYIGGYGLARGYLNRADMTAATFIPNPFGSEPGARLYRTGDLARYLPEGNIEILGRLDKQVKIRGFRVEPDEVEAILRQHPDVQEAAVVVREREGNEKFLVAYFVGGKAEDLRSYLRRQLPAHLLPAAFVSIEALPITPNGKLDRQALPDPESVELKTDDSGQPRTPIEEILVGVWSQVLKREAVGIYDNFFDLGGHSLLATQVVSRVQTIMNIKLPIRAVFEAPTVAELAIRIEEEYQHKHQKPDQALQPISRSGELLLSFAQQRLWFIAQLVPNSPGYNIPTAYQLVGSLKVDVLEKTLNEIIRRHETLRTHFVLKQGQPYQEIVTELSLNLNVVVPSGGSREERKAQVQHLINEAALCPFDLSQGPLIRASVFRLAPEEHVLFLNMHHIIS